MKTFLLELISDATGRVSSARFLNVVIGLCGCLISWKLVLFSQYSVEYFIVLLSYGGGTFTLGKYLENKSKEISSKT